MGRVVHKTIISKSDGSLSDGLEFILSDATPDRYGDTIDADGWVLENFSKNPIALFNHNSSFPIGRWENLGVKEAALRGHLRMAPAGTSERIDELRALIDAGILRAVSVGFVPIESQSIKDGSGRYLGEKYLKQELVETSLVSVPANPNALSVAKSLNISDATMDAVFRRERQTRTTDIRGVEGSTTNWRGQKVPVKRYEVGTWRGQKIYGYE